MSWEPLVTAIGSGLQVWLLARYLSSRWGRRLGRLSGPARGTGPGNFPADPLTALVAGFLPARLVAGLAERVWRAGLSAQLEPQTVAVWCLLGGTLAGLTGVAAAGLLRLIPWPLLAGGCTLLGSRLPLAWLASRERARTRTVLGSLGGVLDLMAACTDGGLGLSQAIELVAARVSGPLGEELGRATRETAAGSTVSQALQSLARRLDLAPVSLLVGALVRAEELGTPVAAILRQQASLARLEQRQAFERALAALPMKLTLCTVVFIFPCLFVLVVLPNLLWFTQARW